MLTRKLINVTLLITSVSVCACNAKPPSQIVYRYDEHRYLELVGTDCEGYIWYHDVKRNIHTSVYNNPIYRIFTGIYIHPSQKYIVLPGWEPGAYAISKDYGKTWQTASYMASFPRLEISEEGYPTDAPSGKNIKRIVVVNDQAFITTNIGHLYLSSYPFDDPRVEPGGPGIDYTYFDEDYYLYKPGKHPKGKYVKGHIDPQAPGSAWGTVIFMKKSLEHLVDGYKANFKNLPDKEPEVTNYKGWDHMRCNMEAGR